MGVFLDILLLAFILWIGPRASESETLDHESSNFYNSTKSIANANIPTISIEYMKALDMMLKKAHLNLTYHENVDNYINSFKISEKTSLKYTNRNNTKESTPLTLTEEIDNETINKISHFNETFGMSPLHKAPKSGHIRVVRELLELTSTVNTKDNRGWTPLHFAAKVGSLSIVKLLLEKNATVNVQNNNGDTPLHWAVWEGHGPVVKELLDKNAFINVPNFVGNTPLFWACWKGDLEVVKLLLDNNAKVLFGTYSKGWSSFHVAIENDQKHIVNELISRDPCVLFIKDKWGNLPPVVAAETRHRGLSDYLRSKMNKNNYNCKNNDYSRNDLFGNSPIHWDALKGNLESIKMVIAHNRSLIDSKKENGDTPLHLASKEGHIEIIEELLSAGASVDISNNESKTPLHFAATAGKLMAVIKLLENNATVDIKDKDGDSPLHWAAWEGHLSVIDELIERNASVNIQNSFGNTPVSWAAWAGRVDVIDLLVKHGADIELKNSDGFNALHRAAEQGQMAAVKALLAKNPSLITIQDNKNRTPHDIAKENKHEKLAEFLKIFMKKRYKVKYIVQ